MDQRFVRRRLTHSPTTTPIAAEPAPPPSAEQQPPPPPAETSSWHLSEQPSPLNVLPSSHCSPRSMKLSPHTASFCMPTIHTSSRFHPPSSALPFVVSCHVTATES